MTFVLFVNNSNEVIHALPYRLIYKDSLIMESYSHHIKQCLTVQNDVFLQLVQKQLRRLFQSIDPFLYFHRLTGKYLNKSNLTKYFSCIHYPIYDTMLYKMIDRLHIHTNKKSFLIKLPNVHFIS